MEDFNFQESYGCIESIRDSRDYKIIKYNGKFPNSHILKIPSVKNQYAINSCVAHSIALVNEYYYAKENLKEEDFSAGFIYGYRPDEYFQGEGMRIRDALNTSICVGNVPYNIFPYNEEMPKIREMVNKKISILNKTSIKYKASKYARLYDINEIKTALLNNIPVIISIKIYKKSFKPNLKGEINYPASDDTFICNHAVVIYGWDIIDGKERFLIQNSWGILWGRLGRAYLPEDYPINEAWALVDEEKSPLIKKPFLFWIKDIFYKLKRMI